MHREVAAFSAVAFAVASFAGCESVAVVDSAAECPPPVECIDASDCYAPPGCAVSVCESGVCVQRRAPAGFYPLDSVAGDCAREVCTEEGILFAQKDFTDVPTFGDCKVGSCDGQPEAKANGTPCSMGLCKDGECVPQIPVYCDTFNIVVTGCAPEQTTGQSIMWSSGGKAHACMGNTEGQAEYCPPGTECYGFVNGVAKKGVCVEHP